MTGKIIKEIISMKDTLQRLLNPKEVLDVRLFDYSQKLLPDVREKILTEVKSRVKNVINEIDGLELYDIYLTGSSASYFYYENSDIDIRADIRNISCKYIAKDDEFLSRFLTSYYSGIYSKYKFMFGTQKVDIKLSPNIYETLPLGLYSILNDKWIIQPQKNITQGLNADEIYAKYESLYYQIKNHLYQLQNSPKLQTLVGIDNLKNLHQHLVINNNSSIIDYIIYKMLKYKGVIRDIDNLYNLSLKNFFSLNNND